MKIPDNILQKYNVMTLKEYSAVYPNIENKEEDIYRQFITNTNHIINELTEGAISTSDCSQELEYREIARQEIARLSGEGYEPKENIKTVEERTTELEQRENTAASYDELAAAIREGVNSYGQ